MADQPTGKPVGRPPNPQNGPMNPLQSAGVAMWPIVPVPQPAPPTPPAPMGAPGAPLSAPPAAPGMGASDPLSLALSRLAGRSR